MGIDADDRRAWHSDAGTTALWDQALDRSLIGYGNVGYLVRRRHWPPDPPPRALEGKVAIVTGAKSGLGKAAVIGMARLGARVHMLIRGLAEGERARADIVAAVPGADVVVEECDVASFASIRDFAAGFHGPLHVLVHNAGVMPRHRLLSADGHELSLATHVLGPHLLTTLLMPSLVGDPPGRIIWVTSGGMYAQRLRLDDLEYATGNYRPAVSYARAKRAQAVLARQWAGELGNSGVIVHAVRAMSLKYPCFVCERGY